VIRSLQRLVLGQPLPTSQALHERLSRPRALGAFGLDALSSVAYGPDEILYVLLLAGSAGAMYDIPVAVAIVVLLAIVVTSYRQTIYAYPRGGGSYTVALDNLGVLPSLVAGGSLMVDYLTTVAVSVTAGVEAIIAFAPGLDRYRVEIDVGVILLLMLVNLRGIREAGGYFIVPTYIFIGSLGALVVWGLVRLVVDGQLPPAATTPAATESVTLFLILRAFAGGCTAMTGVEAIANGVPVFKPPESRNAAGTLVTLACILGSLFMGVVVLGHAVNAVPSEQASVIAQIGLSVVGTSPLFYVVQLSAAIILALAANTSFNGFPLLAAIMAHDGYLPRQFGWRGLRLAYTNGILVLGSLAIVLVIAFGGVTHALIPLFAIGVFLCFTLSQAGMVRHWQRVRGDGWQLKLAINAIGAVTTGIVTLIVVSTKFLEGAWIVVVIIPLLVMGFSAIHAHYDEEARELAFDPRHSPPPQSTDHELVVPVAKLNLAVAETIGYALSLGGSVQAVHVVVDPEVGKQLQQQWQEWGVDVPLELLESPYREVVRPLLHYIKVRCLAAEGGRVTVLLPEVVPRRWWQEGLHNQVVISLELALRYTPNVVVTTLGVLLKR
jgi:amino acid transporter